MAASTGSSPRASNQRARARLDRQGRGVDARAHARRAGELPHGIGQPVAQVEAGAGGAVAGHGPGVAQARRGHLVARDAGGVGQVVRPQHGQPGRRRADGAGEPQLVAGAGRVAAQQAARTHVAGGGDVDHEWARGAGEVAAHQRGAGVARLGAHGEHEGFEGGDGEGVGQHQREQQPRGPRAHGGQVGEVDGHGAAADLGGRAPAQIEVHAFDERVGGLHEVGAPRGGEHGGIVADAHDDIGARRRQVLAEPLEQRVFSAFADCHDEPRCPPGREAKCPAVPCGEVC